MKDSNDVAASVLPQVPSDYSGDIHVFVTANGSDGAGANDLVVAQAARPGRRLPEGTPIAVVVGISPPASSTTGSTAVGNSGT